MAGAENKLRGLLRVVRNTNERGRERPPRSRADRRNLGLRSSLTRIDLTTPKDGASIINTAHKYQRDSECKLRASALARAGLLL
jgi:hypothetical protein